MRYVQSFALAGLAALGGMAVVLGEQDDSPGLGGIGLLLILAAALTCARLLRRWALDQYHRTRTPTAPLHLPREHLWTETAGTASAGRQYLASQYPSIG